MDEGLYGRFFAIEERYWWSVGTRRLFFALLDGLALRRTARVLDVGCGTGIMLHELAARFDAPLGLDYSALALQFCRQRGLRGLARGDATRLPYATDALDLVLALDVVEHLDDDGACLAELARVCRPGGHVLVHVPAFPFLWSDKDVLNHHRRRYRRAALRRLVTGAGLQVRHLTHFNTTVFPLAAGLALTRRERAPGAAADAPAAAASLDTLYGLPAPLNAALTGMLGLEGRLARRLALPFGMSLVCLARKPHA
ncbi:MAG: class I SAM-dependent methyltransferase [Deltaproteobacteria bacterium]|nr:class I SAM-dependent methyltransferase [Deltaproteobacteria bacterium]